MGLAFSSAAAAATPTVLALAKAAAPTVASAALAAVARRGSIAPSETTTTVPSSPTTTTTTVVIEVQVKGALTAATVTGGEGDPTLAAGPPTHPTTALATTTTASEAPALEAESKNEGFQSEILDSLHYFVSDLTGSDVVNDGSLQSPFRTLERALNEIRERGYNTSAKITILDQVQLSAHALNTCVTGKGAQERPLVISTTRQNNSSVAPL